MVENSHLLGKGKVRQAAAQVRQWSTMQLWPKKGAQSAPQAPTASSGHTARGWCGQDNYMYRARANIKLQNIGVRASTTPYSNLVPFEIITGLWGQWRQVFRIQRPEAPCGPNSSCKDESCMC